MNKEKINLLKNYIKSGVSPLLIQNVSINSFENTVVIDSNIDVSELNGHYEETEFCPPYWYKELLNKSQENVVVLVIDKINEIPLKEQTKFVELLKYKKISTFELPKNCIIIVTCSDLTNKKINEEVYSLLAQI